MKILPAAAPEYTQINARKGQPALLKKSGLGIRIEGFSPGAFFPCSVMHYQGQPDREKGKK
jgi:hypothetical protein